MKNLYLLKCIAIIFVMHFSFAKKAEANWQNQESKNSIVSQEVTSQNNSQNSQSNQINKNNKNDSLPAGVNRDWLNSLNDENGNRIIPDEGDAMQQKVFNGFNSNDQYGYSVSSAGDVNGDGYDDIIIGAPYNDAAGANAGRAYIYYGGIIMNTTADVILTGEVAGNNFGSSVSGAGDVNGDGYSDVIVGAWAYSSFAGRAYIYFGGSSMNNVADVTMTGVFSFNNFGYSVSGAGDVNGDGYSDVIIGAYRYSSYTGRAYIYYGGAAMNNVADVTMTGEAANVQFGFSVSGAGDANGDGYADVIVGAVNYSSNTGRAYIYLGGAAMNNIADVTMTGEAINIHFGNDVSGAGDINGDGYSDVIVGASEYATSTGRAYLFNGGAVMDNTADVTLTGESLNNDFGSTVSGAGDVNGDGYSDVIVGANGYSASSGRAYLFYGGTVMNNVVDNTLSGEGTGNYFGFSVSEAGDVNGDGYSDVIIGSTAYNASTGRAYVYTNTMSGEDIPDLSVNGEAAINYFGTSVSSAGDVNGDGYSDVIVGAENYSSNTGTAYIYYGGVIMNNVADVTLTGEAANNYFGHSVSGAGDVNGDGFSDVIVGANGYSTSTGRSYVYFGAAVMNNVADVVMTGEATNNNFGISVSAAGDANGDGYSDVIVGANNHNSTVGRAYIYYGGAAMNNVADVTMTGETSPNYFGISVSGAGDVNGDGYSDVIVGGTGYISNTGRAYIFFGGTAMDNTADVTLTGEAVSNLFGISVAGAGDVNGDGYSDVIAGASGYTSNTGRAYIYYGGTAMNNVADVTMTGDAVSNNFGFSVSLAGDANNDGYSDVIVGAYGYTSSTGRAYIYYGGAAMNNNADVTMTGETVTNNFGISVSAAGDLNGDGYSDVIVGANFYNTAVGRAYIYQSSSPSVKPSIMSAKDVPFDQGGFANLRWARSGYDVIGQNIVTGYLIERSLPPGSIGFAWNTVTTIPATKNPQYFYPAPTLNDSMNGNSGRTFFRITAQTSDPNQYWRSNIMSGYSVDNLAPFAPASLIATPVLSTVNLDWQQNLEADLHHYIIYRNGIQIATSVNSDYNDATALEDSTYNYQIAAVDIHGNISTLSNTAMVTINNFGNINLKAIMEGFYNASLNNMNISDTAKIYLRNALSPYAIVDSAKGIMNSNTYIGSFNIVNAVTGNYFIVFKHRNTIETWSSVTVSYTSGGSTNYSFINSASQAYGNNMIQVDATPVRYAIYSGDTNQDGIVDAGDISAIENDAANSVFGYVPTDLTGDDAVDASDISLVENNAVNSVSVITP